MAVYAGRPAPADTYPNAEVRPLGDGRSLLIAPGGRLFEIDRPPAELRSELESLAAAPGDPPWPELARILRDAGALAPPPPASPRPPVVLADTATADAAARLAAWGPPLPLPGTPRDLAEALETARGRDLVILRDRFDPELLTAVDESRAASGGRWTQFHLDRGRAWLGPGIEPGRGADYRDLLARRRCATQRADLGAALLEPAVGPALRPPPEAALAWLVGLFLAEVQRWLDGGASALVGNEIEADPADPAVRLHPLLPLPDKQADPALLANHRVSGTDLLRGERLGIVNSIRHITHHPSIPRQLATVQADVTDMGRINPWAPNTVCGGSAFGDADAARAAAIGESAERYCGNWVRPDLTRLASYNELVRGGTQAVDPESLVLYSEAQYAAPGFPFVPFTRDLPVQWIEGASLSTGRPTWVPASLVYVNWYVGPFADAPKTNYPFYAGLAAGADFESAVRSALEEIIERDATMLWWANRQPLPVLDPPPRLAALFDGAPAEHGQRAWLVSLENQFGAPVLAGVVENTAEQILAVGFACRDTPEDAAHKAWAEALTLQEIARDLGQPDGKFWRAVRGGVKRQGFMKPWRSDRRYIDDFRDDLHDVGDLECQMQFYLDPRAQDTARPWLQGGPRAALDSMPSLPDRSLATYQGLLERSGHEVVAVDLTTPDVAASGLSVVRAVVPGLVSNFPAAFPFNGLRRLRDAPVALGWRDAPLAEDDLNTFPLPHA